MVDFIILGLKFSRSKKGKTNQEELSESDQRKFLEEGELFAKELSIKLEDELGNKLCSISKQ